MKKNILKISTIIMLVAVIVFTFAMPAFASAGTSGYNVVFTSGDSSGASDAIVRIIGAILNMVKIIGVGVATIMLIVLAIKYISAAPNDKAEIKKHAIVYVVGAVILFSASGIIAIIQKFALNI